MKIEDLIPGTNLESTDTEFKGIIREGKKENGAAAEIGWLKTIAAFANTEGGNLYIGVEDKRHTVVALDHQSADKVILMIHRQVKARITPIPRYRVSTVPVRTGDETRYVILVHVEVSRSLPVVVHESGLLGIYVRNYGQTELASPEQIRDMVLISEQIPYDRAFTDQTYSRDDFQKLYAVAQERNVQISEKQLISIGFMSKDWKLSRGALLFRDSCESDETLTVAAVWPDLDKGSSVVLAHEEFRGDLLTILEAAIEFVSNHSVNGYRKEATDRVAFFSYPARSVTEGIVNAIGHRNYYMSGTQIEINIFLDRLEITSPGTLLGVRRLVREKNIASIIPRRRNEVICSVLEMCRYMEKKGSGFDKIEEDYQGWDEKHQPYISSDAASFTLALPDLTYHAGVTDRNDQDQMPSIYAEKNLTGKHDAKILAFCYFKAHSAREIASYIGQTPSTYFRKNTLGRLVEAGLLREQNDAKPAQYLANHEWVRLQR